MIYVIWAFNNLKSPINELQRYKKNRHLLWPSIINNNNNKCFAMAFVFEPIFWNVLADLQFIPLYDSCEYRFEHKLKKFFCSDTHKTLWTKLHVIHVKRKEFMSMSWKNLSHPEKLDHPKTKFNIINNNARKKNQIRILNLATGFF